jgi:hypothetical protein
MGTAMGTAGSTGNTHMARGVNRLPASYKTLKPGMHCDGGNLYLQVTEGAERNRRRSWIFRYTLKGRTPPRHGARLP